MEIVKELPEVFEDFGEARRNSFLTVKEYKEKGDLRAKSEVIEIVKKCEDDAAVRRFLNEL